MSLSLGFPIHNFLAVGCTLSVLTGIVVSVRIFSDLKFLGRLFLDDFFSILAAILTGATFAIFYQLITLYTDPTASLTTTSQYSQASIWISGGLVWFSKAPILLLYIRLFGIERQIRIISLATLIVLGAVLTAVNSYNTAKCVLPKSEADVTLAFLESCSHASSVAGISGASFALLADIIIFLLPIPVIIKLHLPLSKRIGLGLVFATGLVAIVSTAVALSYKIRSLSGTGHSILVAMILTIVESTVVIMAGAVPALRAFWVGVIVESGIFTAISSLVSGRRSQSGGSTRGEESQEPNSAYVSIEEGRSAKASIKSNKSSSKSSRSKDVNGEPVNIPLKTLPGRDY